MIFGFGTRVCASSKASATCLCSSGACIGPNEIREHQWNNLKSYIGRWVTVKYQTESDDGIPIFPVGIIVRDGSVINGIFVPAE